MENCTRFCLGHGVGLSYVQAWLHLIGCLVMQCSFWWWYLHHSYPGDPLL